MDKPDYLTEISGEHFDSDGDYFVLRLDEGEKDKDKLKAARVAIHSFAIVIRPTNPELADSLKERYPLLK